MEGKITNYDTAKVFPVVPGIEILYFNKECPEQTQYIHSKLWDKSSTIIIHKSQINDFCMIYESGRDLPASFTRYGCDIALLVNTEDLHFEDMQAFPQIWEFVHGMKGNFGLEEQLCIIKCSSEIKEIFDELHQIPLPPTMFRFYMLLKTMELFLQFNNMNLYGTQVHFYPYSS